MNFDRDVAFPNKIRIIDLLNKIANGEEVPLVLKYNNKIYEYIKEINWYLREDLKSELFIDKNRLNEEVEILEEEKKIPEKLDYCEENTFMIKCKENSYLTREEIRLLDSNFKELGNKINSIIDYLKSKGDE